MSNTGATPSKFGRPAGTGYYADPNSPIASTPQRKDPKPAAKTPSLVQSNVALSPMRMPSAHQPQRPDPQVAVDGKGTTDSIFSPFLKFFSNEDEKGVVNDEHGTQYSVGPDGVPVLSPAPAGRRAADGQLQSPSGLSISSLAARTASALNIEESGSTTRIHPSEVDGELSTAYLASPVAGDNGASQESEEESQNDFNPYLFIRCLPPYHTVAPHTPVIALPKKSKKDPEFNLVLDLDETLVHCSIDPIEGADVIFPVEFNGLTYSVYMRKRPHLQRFFEAIEGKYDVTIFTASQQAYAEKLLDILDPEGRFIHHRLFRDSCLNVEGNYLKDLNVLGRDMTKTVLVDNSPYAFGYQIDNGIPIESWFDDKSDRELLKLALFLEELRGKPDVRPLVRQKFRLYKLVQDAR